MTSLTLNGIPLGFIPQPQLSEVTPMHDLNLAIQEAGIASIYGWYAQTYPGVVWDGAQMYGILEDVVASKAIFVPSIMPLDSWTGYTADNNVQAIAIAEVLSNFTKRGVEVRLRFAHEMNFYCSSVAEKIDPKTTYDSGSDFCVSSFKIAFQEVRKALNQIAPSVKMVYNPNIGSMNDYTLYAPDPGLYDYVALDYYPASRAELSSFSYIQKVKPFHDLFAVNGKKFMIVEAGTHTPLSVANRVRLLQMLSSNDMKKSLTELESITWFNWDLPEYQNVIIRPGKDNSSYNDAFLDLFHSPATLIPSERAGKDTNSLSGQNKSVKSIKASRSIIIRVLLTFLLIFIFSPI